MSDAKPIQFGKYQLLDRIAAGGMAEIFKARYAPAPGVIKDVVIKKILPHYAGNKAFISMFTDEARIAMGLSHGNIAQVFDFGAIDGDAFLAMELVDGQPLSKVQRRAKAFSIPAMPQEFAVYIAAELLKGLHYAHTRNDAEGKPLKIVHRDVSPQNVLISFGGEIKIVDFGIARARNASSREDTEASAVKGKYAYFAPEQARARELDHRTDVFAAGIVLYEMLTGQLPFQGKVMDALSKIVRGQFPPPREVNPTIHPDLERMVLKAMSLEKADRYQSAQDFAQELARFLSTHHPDFTPAKLGHFLELLFEEELVHEGRPVKLERSFVEEAHRWKQPGTDTAPMHKPGDDAPTVANPVPDDPGEQPPTVPMRPGLGAGAASGRPVIPRAPAWPKGKPKKPEVMRRALILGALSALVVVAGVLLYRMMSRSSLEIVSTPTEAMVRLDGKPLPQRTPLRLTQIEGGQTYRVEVSAPGHLVWSHEVPLAKGQHLLVEATLEKEPPPPPKPPPPPPKPRPAPDAHTWPVKGFALDVQKHRLDLSATPALAVDLDANTTYAVRLAAPTLTGAGFFVVNPAGTLAGAFTSAPLEVNGATKLFAFRVGAASLGSAAPDDPAEKDLLYVQPKKQKKVKGLKLPPPIELPPGARVTVSGLDPKHTYELIVSQSEPPARIRETGAPIDRVLLGVPDVGLVAADIGVPVRLVNIPRFFVTLLDDGPDGQEGRLEATLVDKTPKRRKKR